MIGSPHSDNRTHKHPLLIKESSCCIYRPLNSLLSTTNRKKEKLASSLPKSAAIPSKTIIHDERKFSIGSQVFIDQRRPEFYTSAFVYPCLMKIRTLQACSSQLEVSHLIRDQQAGDTRAYKYAQKPPR